MQSFSQFLNESKEITKADLNRVEAYADRLFKELGIDVEFSRHFLDRVNDKRNKKQITVSELILLFNDIYKKHGKKLAKLGPNVEAILKDLRTDINTPVAFNWNRNSKMIEMVGKTIMRKKNFHSNRGEPEFKV